MIEFFAKQLEGTFWLGYMDEQSLFAEGMFQKRSKFLTQPQTSSLEDSGLGAERARNWLRDCYCSPEEIVWLDPRCKLGFPCSEYSDQPCPHLNMKKKSLLCKCTWYSQVCLFCFFPTPNTEAFCQDKFYGNLRANGHSGFLTMLLAVPAGIPSDMAEVPDRCGVLWRIRSDATLMDRDGAAPAES